MRRSLVATMLATTLACSPLAFAAPQTGTAAAPAASGKANTRQGKHEPNLFEQLNLTDAQRSSVRQLIRQNIETARPELQAVRAKEIAFNNATPGSANYQSLANDLAQAASTSAHASVLRQADLRTKIYMLLSAEQRTKLATLRAQAQQRMQQQRQARMQQNGAKAPSAQPAASH